MNNRRFYKIGILISVILLVGSLFLPKSMGDTPALIFGLGALCFVVFLIATIVSGIKAKMKVKETSAVMDDARGTAPNPSPAASTIPTPDPSENPTPIPSPAQRSKSEKRCRLCGRKGFTVVLDQDGYCPACAKSHAEFLERQQREAEYRHKREEAKWEQIMAVPAYEYALSDSPRKRGKGYDGVVFSNITPKGKYNDIVVFDTETTGLAPSRDRIIELAAIHYIDNKPVSRFQTYINPERPIPPEASKINGITDEMVADAPTIGAILPAFEAFVADSTLVAHNLDFDLKFLFYSGSSIFETKRKYIDTLEQAQKMIKKPRDVYDHKLDTLCNYYGITIASHHSALADAYATGELFFSLVGDKQSE